MKKTVAILAFALLAASTAFAGRPAATGVNGSAHDMNVFGGPGSDDYDRVCVFCHTPHNGQALLVDPVTGISEAAPLWNHEYGTADFSAGIYQWATPENEALVVEDPLIGPSRLCMTCHDGTVAVDQHGPAVAREGDKFLNDNRAVGLGGDLTTDHPIGFDYTQAVLERNTNTLNQPELVETDQRFADSVTASEVQGSYNTVTRAQGGRTIGDVLYNGTIMTCASCHEVHNKENAEQDEGWNGITPNYLLYAKEKSSLICLSCHIK